MVARWVFKASLDILRAWVLSRVYLKAEMDQDTLGQANPCPQIQDLLGGLLLKAWHIKILLTSDVVGRCLA